MMKDPRFGGLESSWKEIKKLVNISGKTKKQKQ